MITWDIYEVTTKSASITGVMFRGRVRKFCLNAQKDVLVENASDVEGAVRFAVLSGESIDHIVSFIESLNLGAEVNLVLADIQNPVLSKLKVNKEERYTI